MHQNALYLHDAVWKLLLLIQQALADSISLVTQRALPLMRQETRGGKGCCHLLAIVPCFCRWTPVWVSSGSTEDSKIINVFRLDKGEKNIAMRVVKH